MLAAHGDHAACQLMVIVAADHERILSRAPHHRRLEAQDAEAVRISSQRANEPRRTRMVLHERDRENGATVSNSTVPDSVAPRPEAVKWPT